MAQSRTHRSEAAPADGVTTEQDLATMTTGQLRGWLTDHGVAPTSGMRKEDLVKAAVKTMRSDQGTAGRGTGTTGATGKKSTAPAAKARSGAAKKMAMPEPSAGEDVVDLLLAHHQQIKLLFGEMDKARGPHRQQTWESLCRLLAVHESIEQQLVHPLAEQRVPDGDEVIQARLDEERQATEDLSGLWEMGPDDPDFEAGFVELRDAVTEHAELEEAEEFGHLRAGVPAEQLERLAALARTAERTVPSDEGSMEPPTVIADRVREALRVAQK